MNYKEKAIEIATNGASIAFGLILFLAIMIGIPAVFVGLYFAREFAALFYFYVTIDRELFLYGIFIPVLAGLVWLFFQHRAVHLDKKKKEGDA
ncbi:hypothetical protein ACSMEA_05865 [Stenotrophomonas maltophilia]